MIEVNHLCKTFKLSDRQPTLVGSFRQLLHPHYRELKAVDDITFGVEKGEFVGYLGPNGAGKSTTIKMLTGLLVPSSGTLTVDGMIPWKHRTKYVSGIGAVFGQRSSLWWDLPVLDSLEVLQSLYNVPRPRFSSNLVEFRKLLELDEFIHAPVRSLSLGQRMRAELCAALLHDPKILFLDEPTIGLDVVAKERIRRFIQHINKERETTVILTTHDLSDIERLCKRVIILDHGHILYDGLLQSLVERFEGEHLIRLTYASANGEFSFNGLRMVQDDGIQALFSYDHRALSVPAALNMLEQKYTITDFELISPTVEETIRHIYEEKLLLASPEKP